MLRHLVLALLLVPFAGCADDDTSSAVDDPAPVTPVNTAPFTLQYNQGGTVVGGGPTTTPANPDGCNVVQEDGLDVAHHLWEAPGDSNGTALRVLDLTATLTLSDPTLLDADLSIYGPGGALVGGTTDFNVQTGPSETFTTQSGLTPGVYDFMVRGCAGRGAYHLAVTFTLQAIAPASNTTGDDDA